MSDPLELSGENLEAALEDIRSQCQEIFEHCWHFATKEPETKRMPVITPMVCCQCGTKASRIEFDALHAPEGHGSHYPIGTETLMQWTVNGPEFCDRKGRDPER